jgi:hypothetical protein
LISNERWSWEDHEHGLACSPSNAPIDSSTRRSLKSEKEQNSPTSEEKGNQTKDIYCWGDVCKQMRCKWGLVLPRVLPPSTLSPGAARRHPEVAFNSASYKCRCFNCHTADRHKQTNNQKIFQNLLLEKKLS